MNTFWLCPMRGLIPALRFGAPSYAGSYRLVYFDGFKALQRRKGDAWEFVGGALPMHYRGGVYGAIKTWERAQRHNATIDTQAYAGVICQP